MLELGLTEEDGETEGLSELEGEGLPDGLKDGEGLIDGLSELEGEGLPEGEIEELADDE